jgi:hypothetical protein
MSNYAWVGATRGSGSLSASTTIYGQLGQGFWCFAGAPTTESDVAIPWRTAGTFSLFTVRVGSNDRGTSTVTFRKNSLNGNQSTSIGSSLTGEFQDASNTDTVVAGDKVDTKTVVGSGGTTFVSRVAQLRFVPTSGGGATKLANYANAPLTSTSTTYNFPLTGTWAETTAQTETQVSWKFQSSVSAHNLACTITANSNTNAVTAKTRKNGGNGSQSISITAAATGLFEDTTNTDSYVSGDTGSVQVVTGAGTVNFTVATAAIELTSSGIAEEIGGGASGSTGLGQGAGLTVYRSLDLQNNSPTESDLKENLLGNWTLSNLRIYVPVNTVTASSTIRTRKNAANGGQSVSVGSSATGEFTDSSGTDSVVSGDEVDFQIVTGATGTSLGISMIQALASQSPIPTADTWHPEANKPYIFRNEVIPY